MNERDLKGRSGYNVADNGEFSSLPDIISDLEDFISTFSTHSMNEGVLVLHGQKEAYLDVIDYLKRIAPQSYEQEDKQND